MILLPLTPLVLVLLVALAAINALAAWERHKSFREMRRTQDRMRVALVRMSERVEQAEHDPRERETRDGIERVRLAAENARLQEALDQLARDGIGRDRARTIELWPEREARQTVAVAVVMLGGAVEVPIPAGPVPTWYRPTGRFSVSWGVA